MKKAGKNRRSYTSYTKIRGHEIIILAVVVSLLMIIHIPMASASTTIIIATKPLPSDIVFSTAEDYGVQKGVDFKCKRIKENLSDWLNGTRINVADVETCFIDKNIENDELEVMMIVDLEDKRLTLSSLSVDTNCSFLDIDNYRLLKRFEDRLDSIENTTSNNRKTLQDLNETSITLQDLNYSLGHFENKTTKILDKFKSRSENLQNTSDSIRDVAENLHILIGIIIGVMSAILFALISLFLIVGRQDTKKRRR
jgi:uncharacterized coiled-coil protein SlyX